MSDWAQGPGWWQASDGRWYPPETHRSVLLPPPPVGGPSGQGPSDPARGRTILISISGTLVAVLVVVVVVVVVTSAGGSSRTVATFRPVSASASTQQLADDASQLSRRLNALNDRSDSVVLRGRTIDVLGGSRLPVPGSTLVESGTVQFRPALCQSAPYAAPETSATLRQVPGVCSAPQYSLTDPTLIVNTSTGTSNIDTIPLDPALAPYRSSTSSYNDDNANEPVLIPLDDAGGERLLLGSSELTGTAVASAQVAFSSPQWVVDTTLTGSGSVGWDDMSRRYFHEIIGIDLDGRVVSDPLTLPNQATWSSFGGRVQISGDFSKGEAEELVANLESGSLATPLRVQH